VIVPMMGRGGAGGYPATARRIYADTFGADPTGAADSAAAVRAAQASGGSSPYVLVFSVGTYLFDTAPSDLGLDQYVEGQGQGATYFNWSQAGSLWTVQEPGTFNAAHRAGRLSGFTINGPYGSAGTSGISYAGLQGLQLDDIGFLGLDGGAVIGYKFGSSDYAEEAVLTRLSISECGATSGYVFGYNGTSFDYSSIDAVVVVEANIDIVSLLDGAQLQGLELHLRGNCHGASANTGAIVAIERGNTGGNGYLTNATFAVSMEANDTTGTVGHYLLWMGSDSSTSQFSAEGTCELLAAGATSQGWNNPNFLDVAFAGRTLDKAGNQLVAGDCLMLYGGTQRTTNGSLSSRPGGADTVFFQFGDVIEFQLASGNNTLVFSGTPGSRGVRVSDLWIAQPASGAAGTVTWPTMKWASAAAPALSSTNGYVDHVRLTYLPDTASWYGDLIGTHYA
jgi:hypothetical protein